MSEQNKVKAQRISRTKASSENPKLFWLLEENESASVLDVMRDSDRSTAIAIVAMIDDRLRDTITAFLRKHDRVRDGLFKGSGPLATLSAKVDIGLVLGIFGKEMHRDLGTLRRIRNEFAHVRKPLDFGNHKVKALAANLLLPTKYLNSDYPILRADRLTAKSLENPRLRFCRTAQIAHNLLVAAATSGDTEPPEPAI